MNFITFPAAATNIFPAANATTGAQLVTEWNIRSRETINTNPDITYQIGPSFTHSESDFYVDVLRDSAGALVSSHILSISEGRALINGHYVETLVPMTIDLVEANISLMNQARNPLKGQLSIGIRTFYATEQTIMGAILAENEDDMFLGVQLVILPSDELITPADSPADQTKVTADLKLADFTFINNVITNIVNSDTKIECISPKRISQLDEIVSSKYVTKTGLNPKKIYAFAGKGTDPSQGMDTWEDVTDSLIVWDFEPRRTTVRPQYREAQIVNAADNSYLVLPHKQVEGMTDDYGNPEYYASKIIPLPTASYADNSVGLVNREYTRQIKDIATQVSNFRTFLHGKQIEYIDRREPEDELPPINDAWSNGDYILVGQDVAYIEAESDTTSAPSTMYVVLPGQVLTIKYVTQVDGDVNNEAEIPSNIKGVQLAGQLWYESSGQSRPETQAPEYYPTFFSEDDTMLGTPGNASTNIWQDYFKIRYFIEDSATYAYTDYYYAVLTSGPRIWSDAVVVTGSISLATEETIGGFRDISPDAVDFGYVHLDDTGHLVLTDYQLLRSGTLAYQIGADLTIPTLEDGDEIQSYISEYINDRVAFPTTTSHGVSSPLLHIYLPLPAAEDPITLELAGVDSRFNTAICLHIQGNATTKVTLNISDCEKLMIDPSIAGTPVINIFRTNLYYDPIVMQYVRTCVRDTDTYGSFTGFRDLRLWYEQFSSEDPALLVNGMTVSELDAQIISSDINYWKEQGTAANDNNYLVALKSITFSGTSDIIGCEVLAANNSTDNVLPGDKIIVGEFILPQGTNLVYPPACLTRVLKVTGTFTSAYLSDDTWYVTNNSFTLATNVYVPNVTVTIAGTVAFHSTTTLIPTTIDQTSISVWEPDSYHVFSGGAIT